MRTLKKTLCLVLAIVMVLGLGAFSVSAVDFTDASEIKHDDAVALLSGIEVLNGVKQSDGTYKFNPTDTLTRAAACQIITKLLKVYDGLGSLKSEFTDMDSAKWAQPAVAYCATQGIVNGVGGGKFNPNGELTGAAFAKMLLVALGYDAKVEGMTGKSWEVGVQKLVQKTGLATDITYSGTASLSREDACQMAYNALSIPQVEYLGGLDVTTGDGTTVKTGATATPTGTFLAELYGLGLGVDHDRNDYNILGLDADTSLTGIIVANGATDTTLSGKTVVWAIDIVNGKVDGVDSGTEITYNFDSTLDDIGAVVTVQAADATAGGDILAKTTKSTSVKATETIAAGSGSTAKVVAVVGSGMSLAADSVTFDDEYAPTDNDAKLGNIIPSGKSNVGKIEKGSYVIFNKEIIAFIPSASDSETANLVSKVTAYTAPTESATGSVTVAGLTADGEIGTTAAITLPKVGDADADAANITLYDGVAKDDFVYITKVGDNAPVATKAEVVENTTITAKASDNKSLTAGGTSYTALPKASAEVASVTANATALATLGLTEVDALTPSATAYNLVLTPDGAVLGAYAYVAPGETPSTDYVLVLAKAAAVKIDEFATPAYVNYQVVGLDGKTAVVKVYEATGAATTTADGTVIATYADDSEHEGYQKFTVIAAGDGYTTADALTKNSDNKEYLASTNPDVATGIKANNNTVFVLKNADGWAAYTGLSKVPGYTEHTGAAGNDNVKPYAVVKDGYATCVFIDLTTAEGGIDAASSDTSADEVIFLLAKTGEGYDADAKATYDVYDAVVDGAKTEVKVVHDASVPTNKLVKISAKDSHGWLTAAGTAAITTTGSYTVTDLSAKTIAYSAGTMTVDATSYVLTDDAVVYFIKSGDASLTVGTGDTIKGSATGTIYLVANSSSHITTIYYYGTLA